MILAIGVRPETELAKMAGIELGQRGGIRVDEQMRTSNPDIFAVGDAVEVKDFVTGQWTLIPLAGPANRQGRIAADVIAGRDSRYRGTQGTSICQIFEGTIAQTGASEKVLVQLGDKDFEKIYLYANSHAGYYPGAKMLAIKVLFRKSDGRLLGAQVLGEDGVAKRIDSFAMAIQARLTIYDLEEAELSYAPPYRKRKRPRQLRGNGRGESPPRRHAAHPLGLGRRCVSPRCAQSAGTCRRSRSGRGQYPACRNSARGSANFLATGRSSLFAAPEARLLRDAHPFAERLQSPKHLRRHAVPFASRRGIDVIRQ